MIYPAKSMGKIPEPRKMNMNERLLRIKENEYNDIRADAFFNFLTEIDSMLRNIQNNSTRRQLVSNIVWLQNRGGCSWKKCKFQSIKSTDKNTFLDLYKTGVKHFPCIYRLRDYPLVFSSP